MRFFLSAVLIAIPCLALPLSFEKRDATHFLVRLPNGTAQVGPDKVNVGEVTLRFVGAAATSRMEGLGRSSPSTYVRAGLVRTFPQFPRLAIHGLYAGVDAIFYASAGNVEYDLQLPDDHSIEKIHISVEGARDLQIDDQGNLTMHTSSGQLRQTRPRVFQKGRPISARYVLRSANEVGLRLGKHDPHTPLTIDPVLNYVKNFGDTAYNTANLLATDAQGNMYAAGFTQSVDFPTTTNSFDPVPVLPLRVLSNGGQTLSPVRVGTASSVGTVGATPDGRILYAATPQGLLLSGDSGSTWRPTAPLPVASRSSSSLTAANVQVNAISIDSLDPATILVATNAGLYGTDSAGQIWGQRNTGLNESGSGFVWVASVFYHPVNPYIAYAVTSHPSYLYSSSDAGNTWTRLNPTYPGEILHPVFSFSPDLAATISSDGNLLYAINGNGTLLKSPDGGASWVPLAQSFLNPVAIRLDPANATTLYVVDYSGLHKSIDGGLTFSKPAPALDVRSIAVDSSGSVYAGTLTSFYVSTDGANTFVPVPNLTAVSGAKLSASGSKVYIGSFTLATPFVMKLDPTGNNILYSTFLGGSSGDIINGLAVDSQGNAVVVGTMLSPDYPLTVPVASPPVPGKTDGFLTKLSADGTRLLYSTAIGDSKPVTIQAVALDSSGAVFFTGESYSAGFPTTPNAFQPALPSTPCPRSTGIVFGPVIPPGNAFVSKIGADGKSTVFTTFLTGSCGSNATDIRTDAAGDAIVAGSTTSPDFPVSANSYQSAFPGPITQTNPPAILAGGFVAKLSPTGEKLLASTFLGGGYSTQANSVALDAAGNVYATGFTQGFATGATPGAYQTKFVDQCTPTVNIGFGGPYTGTGDAFVLKLDTALSTARFLTYLGGSCNDFGSRIALDPSGNVWVGGTTGSPDFPLRDPFQATGLPSSLPGFVSELSADGSNLLFSTFSEGSALALGPGSVYLAGSSGNSAFIANIDPAKTPAIHIDSVSPVVTFPPATVSPVLTGLAPGQLIQIRGRGLGPATKVSAQMDASGRLPFVLANTVVFFDNVPAPLLSIDQSSIMCFVPFEVVSTSRITVSSNGQVSNAVKTGIVTSAPQVLTITNQDGSMNSSSHPAQIGSVIALYVSGLGQTNPPGDDGLINATPLPVPLVPVTVFFPGISVTPQFVGAAPGMIAGITQVNVEIPSGTLVSGSVMPLTLLLNNTVAPLYTTQ